MQSEPAIARWPWKKWVAMGALVGLVGFGVVLVLGYQDFVHGPTPEQAFERLLCDPIPASVKNIKRPLYMPHMKGRRIALTFEIAPADLALVFPGGRFAPFYSSENGFAREDLAEMVEEIAQPDFIDLKSALVMSDRGESHYAGIIVSGDKRRVFYHFFSDADIARRKAAEER